MNGRLLRCCSLRAGAYSAFARQTSRPLLRRLSTSPQTRSTVEHHQNHQMEADTPPIASLDIKLDANSILEPDENDDLDPALEEPELPPPPPPPPAKAPKGSPLEWLYFPTRGLAGTITLDEILPSTVPITTTGGFETLCSYNWVDTKDPTIIVPGGAAKFNSPVLPVRLKRDIGYTFCDLNRAKAPRQPFKGLFTALAVMSPNTKLDDVDVILTRGAFQTLHKFVKSGCSTAFILQMNVINKTLVLTYREERNKRASSRKSPSWGHAFEEGFTAYDDDLKESLAHHRAIKYQFGSLKVAVLHEVDASYSGSFGSPGPEESAERKAKYLEKRSGATNLGHLVKSNQDVAVRLFGTGTAAENVAEMKATQKPLALTGVPNEAKTQCWFGRTGTLIFGIHENGIFKKHSVRQFEFEPWCQNAQEALQKVVSLFEKLREQTRRIGNCGVAILNPKSSRTRLEIWTPIRALVFKPVSPDSFYRHWTFQNDSTNYGFVQPKDRRRKQ
ncbi:geranylgeranyl pyrophosphate synthetase [Colletotrichum chrysophilum]|uniref:Geranylgeranyl pyrophosphate synthetase n=1 Tax=Colletotrichum chrysophilum TaxID=1836956 RepID=A0AAD9A6F3_9PEZI|nr:geranylgeranyl pyrophosphate synthetase [Colletotrichum chrysophilum]